MDMARLRRGGKIGTLLLIAFGLPLFAWAASSAYDRIASTLAGQARLAAVERVVVVSFESIDSRDQTGTDSVSERLTDSLVRQKHIKVVERRYLGKVMEEQRFQQSGAVRGRQTQIPGRVLGAEAIVTGTVVPAGMDAVEIHARLIHAEDARVLGTAKAKVRRDWTAPQPAGSGFRDVVVAPPALDMDFNAWWEGDLLAGVPEPDPGCRGWQRKVDALQAGTLESKARFWADQLQTPGFSTGAMTKNPGSEIRDAGLRAIFYRRLKELYQAGIRNPPSTTEAAAMAGAEAEAERLTESCGS